MEEQHRPRGYAFVQFKTREVFTNMPFCCPLFLHTPYPYHDFPGRNKGDQNPEQTCDSRPRDLLSICNCSGSCMVSCVAYFVWHVNVSSHVQFSGWRTEGVSDTCADGCTSWSRRQFFGTNSPNVGFESKTTLTICTQPFPHA